MPILSPISNNLTFQQPDLYKGVEALGHGIQAISAGLDKRQFNQERKAYNDAFKQYVPPGDQMMADNANKGYVPPGNRYNMDAAAARAASFGVDTGGYKDMKHREMREQQEAQSLADKNTMGAYNEFKDSMIKAKTSYGNINSATNHLNALKAELLTAPMSEKPIIQAQIKQQEEYIKQIAEEAEQFRNRSDSMADNLEKQAQERYGFINDDVKTWKEYRAKLVEKANNPATPQEQADVAEAVAEMTQDQQAIFEYANAYLATNKITDNQARAQLQKMGITPSSANIATLKNDVNSKAEINADNLRTRQGLKAQGQGVQQGGIGLETAKAGQKNEQAQIKAQGDFIRSNPKFSVENVNRMATLFPAFKENTDIGGNSLSRIIADGFLSKFVNNKDLEARYYAFLEMQKGNENFKEKRSVIDEYDL